MTVISCKRQRLDDAGVQPEEDEIRVEVAYVFSLSGGKHMIYLIVL